MVVKINAAAGPDPTGAPDRMSSRERLQFHKSMPGLTILPQIGLKLFILESRGKDNRHNKESRIDKDTSAIPIMVLSNLSVPICITRLESIASEWYNSAKQGIT
jgi:hypothetical protein